MATLDDEIRTKAEAFATELAVLVRRAALEAAAAALGAGSPTGPPVQVAGKRGRGRPRKAAGPAAVAKPARATRAPKAATARRVSTKRARGEKRPPAKLAELTDKLGDYIKANPGQRMEAIGKALGLATRELNLPTKKLLAAKRIRTKGQKRSTEYFPA